MTTSLVTGVAGFVGSHLADELLERGHRVRGIDNFATGRRENLDGLRSREGFSFREVDVRDEQALNDAVEGVDYVFHQAAVPSVPRSVEDPRPTTSANCLGTANLLTSARDHGVNSVVLASSSSIYGSDGDLPNTEDQEVDSESPYALSKYWTEKLGMQFSDLHDLDTVALRYFNVFGPRQDPGGDYAAVIPAFVTRMLAGKRPVIFGDGEQSRDFTYVDNVVEANMLAATADCAGEVFNVSSGGRITINELAARLNDILGTDLEPRYDDPRPGDIKHSFADISKIQSELGYETAVSFEEGLERTVDYYRSTDYST